MLQRGGAASEYAPEIRNSANPSETNERMLTGQSRVLFEN
jgi:hypothetical protein